MPPVLLGRSVPMKILIHSLGLVGGCCLGLLAWPHTAQGQNFYLNADGGLALADDVEISEFVVPARGTEVKLDPGARFSVAGGYHFNDFVGAQIETGFIYNDIENIDASLAHVPFLADLVLRYERTDFNWIPYIGAGAGGDASIIVLDNVRAPNGARVDGSASAVVFAWQAFAGARYKIADSMSIGARYKFYSAEGASWDVRNTRGDINAGTARIHSFGVDFTMNF